MKAADQARRARSATGLVAGFLGTAAMTVSSTLEARLRHRAASTAPARATAKALGHRASSRTTSPRRASTTSRTGATAPAGASCAACSARPACAPARATAAHGAAIWGSAAVTLPALDIAPPFIFWGKQEVAIDLFHHAVYAVATGLAYEAIAAGRRNGHA